MIRVPLKRSKEKDIVYEDWPVLMPSHLWNCIARDFPNHFEGMAYNCENFWANVRADDPKLFALPLHLLEEDWRRHTVPLCIHGDAGVFTQNNDSLVVVSWSSILHRANTWDCKYLSFAIPKASLCHSNTEGVDTLGFCPHV